MSKLFSAIIFLCSIAMACAVSAQDFDNAFYRKYLQAKTSALDTDANAMVLYEKGTVHINPNGQGYNVVYHLHKIVKIFKGSAQKYGDIKEIYRNKGDNTAYVHDIKGATYNLEGTKIVKTDLDQNTVFDKELNKNYHQMSFALPLVKEGSIVDYEYEIVSPLYAMMPMWEFQSTIPKVKSEYEIICPVEFHLNIVSEGHLQFTKYSSVAEAEGKKKETAYKVDAPALGNKYSILWCKKNIASLKEEPFISDVENYREFFELQISGYTNEDYLSSWPLYNEDLWGDKDFGKVITGPTFFLNTIIDSLTKTDNTQLDKAKDIFNYVRNNFHCSDFSRVYAHHSLNEIFKSRTGNDAEINLLLTAMLRKAGVIASPIVLSKLGELRATPAYPLLDRFNYTACVADIGAERYYLDATNKLNSFGTLPLYCYNGYCRIIDADSGSSVVLSAKNINDKDSYKINISRITDSTMNVDIREYKGVINARKFRNAQQKDSTYLQTYVNKELESFPGTAELDNLTTVNMSDPDKDLMIKYSVKVKINTIDKLYIGTDLVHLFEKNPFVAAERKLPIEFRNRCNYTYSLDILLPENVQPADLPLSHTNKVGDNQLLFDHNISFDSSTRILSVVSKFNVRETYYPATDYEQIKTFFDAMIKEENEGIVLKKVQKN